MKIYRTENYDEMSRKAANLIASQITLNPESVLGIATGSTPEGMYGYLVEKYENKDLDFTNI